MKIKLLISTALLCGLFTTLSFADTSLDFENNAKGAGNIKCDIWYSGKTSTKELNLSKVAVQNGQGTIPLKDTFSSFKIERISCQNSKNATPDIDSSCKLMSTVPATITVKLDSDGKLRCH